MDSSKQSPFYRENLTNIDLTEDPLFIEVCYESDDSRVFDLTMLLYEDLKDSLGSKPRADAVKNYQKHLRGALIALILKAQVDPRRPIISMRDNNFGKPCYAGDFVLYNPFQFDMRKMRDCFDAMEAARYLEIFKGDNNTFVFGEKAPRASRLQITDKLLSIFKRKDFLTIEFKRKIVGEGLIVKVTKEEADLSLIEEP